MLHPAPGTNLNYCGPTAIAAITGLPINYVEGVTLTNRRTTKHARARKTTVRTPGVIIRGMWTTEIEEVMDALGWRVVQRWRAIYRKDLITFAEFRRRNIALEGGPMIVHTGGHFIAISNGMMVDSNNREPIPTRAYRRQMKRVFGFMRFEPKSDAPTA